MPGVFLILGEEKKRTTKYRHPYILCHTYISFSPRQCLQQSVGEILLLQIVKGLARWIVRQEKSRSEIEDESHGDGGCCVVLAANTDRCASLW